MPNRSDREGFTFRFSVAGERAGRLVFDPEVEIAGAR
jgi:hypothetical protein